MNRLLKSFLRIVSHLALIAGGGIMVLMLVAGAMALAQSEPVIRSTVSMGVGVYGLFCCLLISGVLKPLLSIDDRLERLEARG